MTWRLILICLSVLVGAPGCGQEAEQPTRTPTPKSPRPGSQIELAARSQPATYDSAPLPSPTPPSFPARALKPDDWFDGGDGKSRPLPFAYSDGSSSGNYTILEVMGGGSSLLDYNRDGLLDIYVSGGGKLSPPPAHATGLPGALFQNRGDGQFVDVTRAAGLGDAGLYTHGSAVGDYNRDGYPDLFVAGYQGCRLYSNQRDGTFRDETAKSQLVCPNWNMTGCWADIDKDGWLDLYVVTYAKFQLDPPHVCINERKLRDVCLPTDFEGEADMLWRNRGDGTFEDVSHRAGVDVPGRGLGIVAADLDEDGWIDFYVANDVEENVLLYGGPDLAFSSEAIQAGAAYSATGEREGSMGVDLGDYNGDGRPDLFYTNFATQDCSLLEMVAGRG
ncbi:MAG: UnbV, partial [Planctomycetaceae bacterium]|nr:UnbV [Planctomycetaceae bacterium]